MTAWVHGTASISPQGSDIQLIPKLGDNDTLNCIEPDYEQWIDSRQLRRMSRAMKLGVTAAMMTLKNAGIEKPDAIIAGTGFGCMEDTGTFLTQLVREREGVLNPTPFMQSTHNTIASAISIMLQCNGYNSTYTQNAFSFEHALLDALLQIELKPRQHILVGGIDEMTDDARRIFRRLGVMKRGIVLGEGAAWALLSGEREKSNIAVSGVATYLRPTPTAMVANLDRFLSDHHSSKKEIDLVLCGVPGANVITRELPDSVVGTFKHLCGEHPSASAFAFWLAENILRSGKIPGSVLQKGEGRSPGKILIYNQYFRDHHSLILLGRS